MQPNSIYTATLQDEGVKLPLQEFFTALRANNFMVSPQQIADCNRAIEKYAGTVKSEHELSHYLCPIFAHTQEDQLQFQEIFNSFFGIERVESLFVEPLPTSLLQRFIKFLNKYGWLMVGLLFLLILLVYFFSRKPALPRHPVYNIILNEVDEDSDDKQRATQSVKAVLQTSGFANDTLNSIRTKVKYDWGDGVLTPDSIHFFSKNGIYTLTAFIDVFFKDEFQWTDTASIQSQICVNSTHFEITKDFEGDTLLVNRIAEFEVNVGHLQAKNVSWTVEPYVDNGQNSGLTFSYFFKEKGNKIITATFNSAGADSGCTSQASLSFYVKDNKPPSVYHLAASVNAKDIKVLYEAKPVWYNIAALLLLLSGGSALFFLRKQETQNSDPKKGGKRKAFDLKSFEGTAGATELVFKNKNYLPLPETEMIDVAQAMRKRIEDETVATLDLNKTINNAVNNAGFFLPAYKNRMHQSEFLVLIDEEFANSQQVKLFEYLVQFLIKENVFVDTFYYHKNIRQLYNKPAKEIYSLETLSSKYPRHVLLILSNGYQLLYEAYPTADQTVLEIIRRWKYRGILTPVSYPDWGAKESSALQEMIPVMPVDIPGQLLLMKKIFGEEFNSFSELKKFSSGFYNVEPVDFEDVDELFDYCEEADWARGNDYSNILFQWVAAVAVYPGIRWELILAIGKNILDRNGKSGELNFTNLLRIARVRWMQQGKYPSFIRVKLLKLLSTENEVIARETVLAMLDEMPEINDKHFSYEEKEVQRLTNEFNLYAHNPEKYPQYESAVGAFEELYASGSLTDMPALTYLENPDAKWMTLVNKMNLKRVSNVPLKEYFIRPAVTKTDSAKNYRTIILASALAFVASLAGLLYLISLNNSTKNYSLFNTAIEGFDSIRLEYHDSAALGQAETASLMIDTNVINLTPGAASYFIMSNSRQPVSVAVTNSGITEFDTSMIFDKNDYTIIRNRQYSSEDILKSVKLVLTASCGQNLETYRSIIRNVDTSIRITTVSSSGVISGASGCLTHYSYGNKVNPENIKSLIEYFKSQGIVLERDQFSSHVPGTNELIIYSNQESLPNIRIAVSEKSLFANAGRLRNQLLKRGYNVAPVAVESHNYTSRIQYFDAFMSPLIQDLKSIHDIYFPGIITSLQLSKRSSLFEKNAIFMWVSKPVVNPMQKSNTLPQPQQNKRADSLRKIKILERIRQRRFKDSMQKLKEEDQPWRQRNTLPKPTPNREVELKNIPNVPVDERDANMKKS